jgi:hypothetical protein
MSDCRCGHLAAGHKSTPIEAWSNRWPTQYYVGPCEISDCDCERYAPTVPRR